MNISLKLTVLMVDPLGGDAGEFGFWSWGKDAEREEEKCRQVTGGWISANWDLGWGIPPIAQHWSNNAMVDDSFDSSHAALEANRKSGSLHLWEWRSSIPAMALRPIPWCQQQNC